MFHDPSKSVNKFLNISVKFKSSHGCKVFGVTIHWVIPEVDVGPIITQRAIHKFDDDTLEEITKKIHKIEHYVYPKTIKKLMKI